MRFANSIGTDVEDRAARGDHVLYFEEGDHGPALRAQCPFLQISAAGDDLLIPYVNMADITLRFMSLRDATVGANWFYKWQHNCDPINRSWQIIMPELGLHGACVCDASGHAFAEGYV